MGSEVSTELEKQIHESRNGLKRSNSLRAVGVIGQNRKYELDKCGADIKNQKSRKQVRRSQTFSSLSNMTRQRIKPETSTNVKEKLDMPGEIYEFDIAATNEDLHKETGIDYSGNNDEDFFIPSKNNNLNRPFPVPNTETHLSTQPNSSYTDETVSDDAFESSNTQQMSGENTELIASNLASGSPFDVDKARRIRQKKQSKNDEPNPNYADKTNTIDNGGTDSESNEEFKKKPGTINRRNQKDRRKVARSKSWSIAIDRYSVILEDEQLESPTTSIPDNPMSSSPAVACGRRTSDTYLLREQHVKRSEQFSAMLKQINDNKPETKELSTYGLGVITGNRVKQEQSSLRLKSQRQNDYFNNWVKEQGQRISMLSLTLKGSDENGKHIDSLYNAREHKAYLERRERLPAKPKSASLPRRRKSSKITNYISSSDSEDNLLQRTNSTGSKPTLDDQQRLKKQLSDTILLVDNSFRTNTTNIRLNERACTPSPKLLVRKRVESPTSLKLNQDFKGIDNETDEGI